MANGRLSSLMGLARQAKGESKERPINADVPIEYPPQKPRTFMRTGNHFMRIVPIPERRGIYDPPEGGPNEVVVTLHPEKPESIN